MTPPIFLPSSYTDMIACPNCSGSSTVNGMDCPACKGAGRLPMEVFNRRVVHKCKVPVGGNEICGHLFFEGEERRAGIHTARCATENHEHVMAEYERKRPAVMRPWDTELDQWIKDHKVPIIEGRTTV